MTRVLLLGRSGQIGGAIERALRDAVDLTALSRAELDITDPVAVSACLKELQPQLLINAAAWTAVDKAEQDSRECDRVNAIAPGLLAREAASLGAALLHFSTDYVFDGSGDRAWTEVDEARPLNAYGRAKLSGEQAIRTLHPAHLIMRTSWIYDVNGSNFLRTMLRLIAEREELRVVADQYGAPTSADAVASAVAAVLAKAGGALWPYFLSSGGLVHCACRGVTTWHGFAQAIFREAKERRLPITARNIIPIATKDYPLPARRPANSRLSLEKMETFYGIQMPNWQDALKKALDRSQQGPPMAGMQQARSA